MLYEYLCNHCEHSFEATQSIKEDAITRCPQCDQESLGRVLHPPQCFIRGEPVTIGQQAEKNERGMGTYQLQDRRREVSEAGEEGRRAAGRQPSKRPWWRKTDKVDTSLATMAPKVTIEKGKVVDSEPLGPKANKYIMTGKK